MAIVIDSVIESTSVCTLAYISNVDNAAENLDRAEHFQNTSIRSRSHAFM